MDKQKFDTGDYIEVSARIAEFRTRYPQGSLQPADPAVPYRIETLGDKTFVVVVAAAYRSPEDTKPGIGMAMEQFPGKTNFTRDSELQNAETSAWGRAMVATLAVDTKHGIASADEVRARTAAAAVQLPPADFARTELMRFCNQNSIAPTQAILDFAKANNGEELRNSTNEAALTALLERYRQERK